MPTYVIRYRRDTTANWLAANPILLDGEMGYERTEDGRLLCKMGDGVCGADGTVTGTHWVDLPYCSGPAGPSPEFEWADTSIRFRNPDGTWGEWHDIRGERGLQGIQGVPGPTGESVPATRTTLGGVIIGSGLDVTAEGCLEVLPDGATVTMGEDGLLSALGGNLLLNSEAWITESGTFVAPVKGWYEVLLIGGGAGGYIGASAYKFVQGGMSGEYKRALRRYEAGEEIEVTIGAGGIGTTSGTDTDQVHGGNTVFDGIVAVGGFVSGNFPLYAFRGAVSQDGVYRLCAGGGPGNPPGAFDPAQPSYYGAGGGAAYAPGPPPVYGVGAGAPGAVRLRWHDRAKAAGQQPAPALLSARRMAPRAADAPATVNLYDPVTGQGSVWREEDAEAKLAEGMITEAAWLEICAAKAAEDYAAWLANPDTETERFAMLRVAREARLAATDYLVAPDYPLTDEQRTAVTAYRQALRDLPAQEGAPWDGGGEGTPWPGMPTITKAQES